MPLYEKKKDPSEKREKKKKKSRLGDHKRNNFGWKNLRARAFFWWEKAHKKRKTWGGLGGLGEKTMVRETSRGQMKETTANGRRMLLGLSFGGEKVRETPGKDLDNPKKGGVEGTLREC